MVQCSTTNILPPENYPLYGMKCNLCQKSQNAWLFFLASIARLSWLTFFNVDCMLFLLLKLYVRIQFVNVTENMIAFVNVFPCTVKSKLAIIMYVSLC